MSSLRLLSAARPPLKANEGDAKPPQAARSSSLLREVSCASFPKSNCDVYDLEIKKQRKKTIILDCRALVAHAQS